MRELRGESLYGFLPVTRDTARAMSQENVAVIRQLWLAYVRRDYEASTEALDDAVAL
jgi:hypothetical protein